MGSGRGSRREIARTTWTGFSEGTSMHGLANAVGRAALWKRLIWTLLVLGGLAMAVYNLTQTIQDFLDHPVSTRLTMEYDPSAQFPAVTICNMNRFHMARLQQKYDLNANMDKWKKEGKSLELQAFQMDLDLRKEYGEYEFSEMGHKLKDMLITCEYSGTPCDEADFQTFYNFKYGNCFTFNTYKSTDAVDVRYTTRPGLDSGLVLELDIEQSQYTPLTATAGVMLVVHHGGEMPYPEEDGLAIGPGMATSVGVRKVEISRAPPPYTECVSLDDEEGKSKDIYALAYGYQYTSKGCRKTCQQITTYDDCACCDMGYPCIPSVLTGNKTSTEEIPLCVDKAYNENDNDTLECLQYVVEDVKYGYMGCGVDRDATVECKQPCEEVTYTVRVSQALWPSTNHEELFIFKANQSAYERGKNFSFTGDQDDYVDSLRDTLVRLEVFYEQLNFERLESVPMYTWNRLLGDIGGQLGLYLGFSILTAVEWIEFFFDLLTALCCVPGQVKDDSMVEKVEL